MSLENLTALEWVPKITYSFCDSPTTFTLQIPQRNWGYFDEAHGGFDEVDSGEQEAFVTRHDRGLVLRLRITENEWIEDISPFLKAVLAEPQAFEIQLDQADSGTAEDFRLVSPRPGERIQPTPNEFDGVLELELVVRVDDGSAPPFPYFPALG